MYHITPIVRKYKSGTKTIEYQVRVGYEKGKPIFEKRFIVGKGRTNREVLREAQKWAGLKAKQLCEDGYCSLYSSKTRRNLSGYPEVYLRRNKGWYAFSVHWYPTPLERKHKSFSLSKFDTVFDAYKTAVLFKKEKDLERYSCFVEPTDKLTLYVRFFQCLSNYIAKYGEDFAEYLKTFDII